MTEVSREQPPAVSSGDTAFCLLPRGRADTAACQLFISGRSSRRFVYFTPRRRTRDSVSARHVRRMQHGCILLHPDAQNPFLGLPRRCVVLHPSPQRPSAPSSRAASQTSPCNRSGKPQAAAGLLGLVRARQGPHQAVSGCGGVRTHCLDGRGADEVSWDATQRVQSVGAWQLNSAALAPWRHRLRPIAPRDWVEIRCLLPAVLWVMRAIGGALFVRSADQHSERGESKQTSSSSASSMIFPKSLPSFYLSYTRILIRSGSHNGPGTETAK